MESEKPKRNLYRGLLRHIRENYDWKNATPAAITAALQKEERWRGVSIGSVAPPSAPCGPKHRMARRSRNASTC